MISPTIPMPCESVTITTDAFRIEGEPPGRLEPLLATARP